MQIILKQINIGNFKGLRNKVFTLSPFQNTISGDNGTGKTTILDAFLWALFDKDSTDRKQFEIKTLDKDGNVIHRVDQEVELIFDIDFKEVSLKKVLREKWQKPRGSNEEVFTGNESLYFWNDVPMKASDYSAKIAEIIDENLFKLLSNVAYFHSLHWEKRREIIFDLAGKINESDVVNQFAIANKEKVGVITGFLNAGKTIAEAKAEIAAKKKKIKDELQHIPARIDEAHRSKPEQVDIKAVETEKSEINNKIMALETELNSVIKAETDYAEKLNQANKAYNDKLERAYSLKNQKSLAEKQLTEQIRSQFDDPTAKIQTLQNELGTLENQIARLYERIDNGKTKIADYESKIVAKRQEWADANAVQIPEFEDTNCTCPTCKQSLPEDDIKLRKNEFISNFNRDKSERLATIQSAGKDLAGQKSDLESLLNDLIEESEALKARQVEIKDQLFHLKPIDLSEVDRNIQMAIAADGSIKSLTDQIAELESSLATKPSTSEAGNELFIKRQHIQQNLTSLNFSLQQLSAKSGRQDQIAVIDKRIAELTEMESKLANELAGFEGQEFAILEYEKERVRFIENKINDKFSLVSFKMFDTQINGSEIPCCKTLINGVPYEDANNASKINAGIDIINALSDNYDTHAPVFIDNAESINEIMEIESQSIRLVVSHDPDLTLSVDKSIETVTA